MVRRTVDPPEPEGLGDAGYPQWPPNSVGFHLDGPAGTIGVNDVMVGPTTYAVTAYQFPSIHPEPWAIEAHTVCVQPTFG